MSKHDQTSELETIRAEIVARNRENETLPAWRRDLSVPVPVPGRATRVASWIGWHFMELTGVTVPAVAAVAVTPWAWLVSGVVGVGWAVHEVPDATEQARLRAELNARRASAERAAAGSGMDEVLDGPVPDPDPDSAAESGESGESVDRGATSGDRGGSGGAGGAA